MTIGPLPRMAPVTIGGIEVHSLLDDVGPTVPPATLCCAASPTRSPGRTCGGSPRWAISTVSGKLRMAYQSYLVKAGDRRILIDAAVGEDGNFPNRPAWHGAKSNWLGHLGETGTAPEPDRHRLPDPPASRSHGMADAAGQGAWVPTFGAARHLASRVELDYWPAQHEAVGYMSTSYPDCVEPRCGRPA